MAKNQQTQTAAADRMVASDVAATTHAPAGPRIRFSPPSYAGKNPDTMPNIANGVILGVLGAKLELAGFTLALNRANSTISVYMPKTAPLTSAPEAVQIARHKAPDGIETDSPDGTLPVNGGRAALDAFKQSVLDAWARCNAGGQTAWGTEFPLTLG